MITRLLRVLLCLASAASAAAFVFIALGRLGHPRELDPIEGLLLDQAVRLAHHEPAYLGPAAPLSVMPGFSFVVSLLVGVLGPNLWEPRLVALLATLAAAGVVMVIARAETESWTVGIASGGIMLMGCGLATGTAGMARPEPFMLLLALTGFVVLRYTGGVLGTMLAVILLGAACLTQEVAVWFMAGAIFFLACEDRQRCIAFVFGMVLLGGGAYVLLSQTLGPWFNFSAWDVLLQSLQFEPARLLHYVGDQLLGKLGVLTLPAVLSFALPNAPWRGGGGIWICVGIATLVAGLLTSQSAQVGPHSLIPSVVVLSLLGPISMQRVTRHLAAWPGSSRLGGQGVVLAALALQFIMLVSSLPPSLFTPEGDVSERPSAPPVSVEASATPTPESQNDAPPAAESVAQPTAVGQSP